MKGYRSILPGLALGLATTTVLGATVGGNVAAINLLSSEVYTSTLTIVGASGLTGAVIVTGTINNNDQNGWDLTVTSANAGKLQRGTGGAGRELAYNNITFVNTGGTLGVGLTPPDATRNIATGAGAGDVAGTTHFFTHSTFTGTGTATSATTDYTFELRISATANTSLLSGTYTDNITLSLSNDS